MEGKAVLPLEGELGTESAPSFQGETEGSSKECAPQKRIVHFVEKGKWEKTGRLIVRAKSTRNRRKRSFCEGWGGKKFEREDLWRVFMRGPKEDLEDTEMHNLRGSTEKCHPEKKKRNWKID